MAHGWRAEDADRGLYDYAAGVRAGIRYHTSPDPFGKGGKTTTVGRRGEMRYTGFVHLNDRSERRCECLTPTSTRRTGRAVSPPIDLTWPGATTQR